MGTDNLPELFPTMDNYSQDLLLDEGRPGPSTGEARKSSEEGQLRSHEEGGGGDKSRAWISCDMAPSNAKRSFGMTKPLHETVIMECWIENFYITLVENEYGSGNKSIRVRLTKKYKAKDTQETKDFNFEIPAWHFEQLAYVIELIRIDKHYLRAVELGNAQYNVSQEDQQEQKRKLQRYKEQYLHQTQQQQQQQQR